jgi:hypothetical protein
VSQLTLAGLYRWSPWYNNLGTNPTENTFSCSCYVTVWRGSCDGSTENIASRIWFIALWFYWCRRNSFIAPLPSNIPQPSTNMSQHLECRIISRKWQQASPKSWQARMRTTRCHNTKDQNLNFNHSKNLKSHKNEHIVAYRIVNKQWLYKQRPLHGNSRNIRKTGLCNQFLSNGSVKTFTIGVLFETMFSVRSVQSRYKKDFSWESTAEFRSFKWAVSQELGSARAAEKMALWVQVLTSVQRRDHGSWRISTVLNLLPGKGS